MNLELVNPPYTLDWINIRSGKVIKKEMFESFPASISIPALPMVFLNI